MKIATFDLEIAKVLPPDTENLLAHAPLGISCAAIALNDLDHADPVYFARDPQLTRQSAKDLVEALELLVADDYTIVTWNGLGFDFRVLAQESGLSNRCANLALNHWDMMLNCTWVKGWYLGLDTALDGAGIAQKTHTVTLKDGSVIHDMNGAKAPELWAAGEHIAVMTYLKGDVVQLMKLALQVDAQKVIRWITKSSGRQQQVPSGSHMTVAKLLQTPHPDTSWMGKTAPTRKQFLDWIPGYEKLLENISGKSKPLARTPARPV